jgi:hypothetical protein
MEVVRAMLCLFLALLNAEQETGVLSSRMNTVEYTIIRVGSSIPNILVEPLYTKIDFPTPSNSSLFGFITFASVLASPVVIG